MQQALTWTPANTLMIVQELKKQFPTFNDLCLQRGKWRKILDDAQRTAFPGMLYPEICPSMFINGEAVGNMKMVQDGYTLLETTGKTQTGPQPMFQEPVFGQGPATHDAYSFWRNPKGDQRPFNPSGFYGMHPHHFHPGFPAPRPDLWAPQRTVPVYPYSDKAFLNNEISALIDQIVDRRLEDHYRGNLVVHIQAKIQARKQAVMEKVMNPFQIDKLVTEEFNKQIGVANQQPKPPTDAKKPLKVAVYGFGPHDVELLSATTKGDAEITSIPLDQALEQKSEPWGTYIDNYNSVIFNGYASGAYSAYSALGKAMAQREGNLDHFNASLVSNVSECIDVITRL